MKKICDATRHTGRGEAPRRRGIQQVVIFSGFRTAASRLPEWRTRCFYNPYYYP